MRDPISAKVRETHDLLRKGFLADADRQARRLVEAHPKRPDIQAIRGLVYLAQGKRGSALPHFISAVKASPNNPLYLNTLGRLYLDLELVELALPLLDRALTINPRDVDTMWAIGGYFTRIGQAERGLSYLEKGMQVDPKHTRIALGLGMCLETLGRTDEAIAVYRALVVDVSTRALALDRLSELEAHDGNSPTLMQVEELISSGKCAPRELNALHTAAGRIHDARGEYDRAFEQFRKANEAAPLDFDIPKFRSWVDSVIATFDDAFFAQRAGFGTSTELPVFIVGMPRAGSTLTERIIANHKECATAGEVMRLARMSELYSHHIDIARFTVKIDELGTDNVQKMGDNYLQLLNFLAPNSGRIIDKMPLNFILLGFIALLFPNARVIHTQRNPADTCWSCYQNRLSEAHRYSRDLRTLGLYYREYLRLMAHWKKVLPLRIHESRYEDLTADPETKARELIDFIGLEWDPACLKFHEAKSTVRTISLHQVRKPVNTQSVERWRRYEKNLGPLIEALGDAMN